MKKYRVILSGGGTGGHIYPAVSVAEALTKRLGDSVEILFVGAQGKMEMERVPALGYNIVGLSIVGLKRSLSPKDILHNLAIPFKLCRSIKRAKDIIREFKADIVVGFGGYASAPVLFAAQSLGIPTIIQEQNSYAGVTNKLLARRAKAICVAYEGMGRFFDLSRTSITGNPLRGNFSDVAQLRSEGLKYFGLDADKPIILVVGGSLGTRTLNNMMKRCVELMKLRGEVQVIWQIGKFYYAEIEEFMSGHSKEGIWYSAFIDRMDYAYAISDLVIGRSGACTVSELCLVGKPTLFVPSPNVAEDHQTKNAQALVDIDAAVMIEDSRAVEEAIDIALGLLRDRSRCDELSKNINKLAIVDSADRVAERILGVVNRDV